MPNGTTGSCPDHPPGLPPDLRDKYLSLDDEARMTVCKEIAILVRHRKEKDQ